jgi:hypothetical protein
MAFERIALAHAAHGELTLIAEGEWSSGMLELYDLSAILQQECIAVWILGSQRGVLIGPKAEKWGPFNIDLFLFPPAEATLLDQPLPEEVLAQAA